MHLSFLYFHVINFEFSKIKQCGLEFVTHLRIKSFRIFQIFQIFQYLNSKDIYVKSNKSIN
jgi:hypothetical protein